MNGQLKKYQASIDALSLRERALMLLTVLVLLGYGWWYLWGQPQQDQALAIVGQNKLLVQENSIARSTIDLIQQRIDSGVNKEKIEQVKRLESELERVNIELKQKTLEMIEPDEMFDLMLQLINAESRLSLTGLKRNSITAVFKSEEHADQPQIYRHVMQIAFKGKYLDVLNYISRLEALDWKLIWDRISLKTDEYPTIQVEIEISTLSDSRHWVEL